MAASGGVTQAQVREEHNAVTALAWASSTAARKVGAVLARAMPSASGSTKRRTCLVGPSGTAGSLK
jgi:hypothetical protein